MVDKYVLLDYPIKRVFCSSFADMAELADALDLGSSGRPCRFDSCYPQQRSSFIFERTSFCIIEICFTYFLFFFR